VYIHGQMMVSLEVGHMHWEYSPQKQCLKNTWRVADMVCRCLSERDPMMRSDGREDSGTGIMPPVQQH